MEWSTFGEKFCGPSGIVDLMEDIGEALALRPDTVFMGGGNPARVPGVEEVFAERLQAVLDDPERRHAMLGVYQLPRGDEAFRTALARMLRADHGWDVGPENIAVSNGSQAAFFVLFNLLAGPSAGGRRRHILLPLVPEYIGYADAGLGEGLFRAERPRIECLPDALFKYRVDFGHLAVGPDTAAICVSRPTNPTGNVLTDDEIRQLDALARANGIPLIIDGAYGTPFPRMIFTEARPHWNDNTVLLLSLSKLGLPGLRTGIVVARPEIIDAWSRANTILNLACGNVGPALGTELLRDGMLARLSEERIRPFYAAKAARALERFREAMQGLPYRIHAPEGAMFLWLWLEGIPGGSHAFYQRLKQRGALVVPGREFFVGLAEPWAHRDECLRVSYAQDDAAVARGIAIIADEARRTWDGG